MTENGEGQQQQYVFASALRTATRYNYFTWIIVAVNVAYFVVMGISGVDWFAPETAKLLHWGADFWPYTSGGQWWRLITGAFMHIGALHIAMNMWALISIGHLAERLFGNFFFLLVYFFCAILSSLVAIWWDQRTVEAGASGAIFGVYGATLAYLLCQNDSFPKVQSKPLITSVMTFIAYNVYAGLTSKHTSNSAHMSGLVSGFVIGAIVCRPLDVQKRSRQTVMRMAAGLVFGSGIVAATFLLIPKSHYDVTNEQAFAAVATSALKRERDANERYNDIVKQQKTLPPAEIADRLDREVIPSLDGIVTDLASLSLRNGTETQALRDLWVRYLERRVDADRAWSQKLRSWLAGNFAEARKIGTDQDRLWKEAEDLQKQVERAIAKHPGI